MSSKEAEGHFNIPCKTVLNNVKGKHHFMDVLITCAEFGSPITIIEIRMLIKNYLNSKGIQNPFFKEKV